jgi:hypothetical protein
MTTTAASTPHDTTDTNNNNKTMKKSSSSTTGIPRTDSYQQMKRAMESFNIEESMVRDLFFFIYIYIVSSSIIIKKMLTVMNCSFSNFTAPGDVFSLSLSFETFARERTRERKETTFLLQSRAESAIVPFRSGRFLKGYKKVTFFSQTGSIDSLDAHSHSKCSFFI